VGHTPPPNVSGHTPTPLPSSLGTKHTENPINQSKLEVNMCTLGEELENICG